MRVTLNGKPKEVRKGITLAEILKDLGILPERVACEVNLNVIRRMDYEKTKISAGDKIEVVQVIGGGLMRIGERFALCGVRRDFPHTAYRS